MLVVKEMCEASNKSETCGLFKEQFGIMTKGDRTKGDRFLELSIDSKGLVRLMQLARSGRPAIVCSPGPILLHQSAELLFEKIMCFRLV